MENLARLSFKKETLFQFLMGSVMDINTLYQYITTSDLINITIKNIAINTGRLWPRPVLGQSKIVCRSPYWMYKVTHLSACVASALWRAGDRSPSGRVRSVARRALILLNAPLVMHLIGRCWYMYICNDYITQFCLRSSIDRLNSL